MVENNHGKTYVITAAQAIQSEKHARFYGGDRTKGYPHLKLITNMDRFAKKHNGETMILQMQGMSCDEVHLHPFFETRNDIYINKNKLARLEAEIEKEREKQEWIKEKLIKRRLNFEVDVREADYFTNLIGVKPLNSKVVVADLIVPPQNKDPTTGRLDIPQNQLGKTIIFAHAKQRWRSVPKSMGRKYPRLLMTTGACTLPNYNQSNSRGDIAAWNHKFGFVVVDVVDGKRYFPRIVPALKNGTFVDMGIEYRPGQRPKKIPSVEAMVLGDIHYGDHDDLTMDANREMIEYFNPKNVFLHDAFNGHSTNPHEREDTIKRAIAFKEGRLDIKQEFEEAYDIFIEDMAKSFKKTHFWFIYSNHSPAFMRRYLTSCQFIKEPWNDTIFISQLREALLQKGDSIKRGLEMIAQESVGRRGLPKNVHFLGLGEDKRILGYELSAHGHKGSGGSRGNPQNMKAGYGKGVSGHTHSPGINGDWYVVGTSSKIPLSYAKGQPGSQMPANFVMYPNGLCQLLPIIVGKWRKE